MFNRKIVVRAKELRQAYMQKGQSEDGKSVVHAENISMILWEVIFPLEKQSTLNFPLDDGMEFISSMKEVATKFYTCLSLPSNSTLQVHMLIHITRFQNI